VISDVLNECCAVMFSSWAHQLLEMTAPCS